MHWYINRLIDELMGWIDDLKCRKSTKTTPGAAKNDPKRSPRRPKTTPRGAQDDQKSDPERQDEKRTEPRADINSIGVPLKTHLGGQKAPKSIPKQHKIVTKNQEVTKPIQNDLGSVLRRFWAILGDILGPWKRSKHYACRGFVKIQFFDVTTVRRRSWDRLWPTKATERPKMTPKTDPKSTPRQSKIDVKIDFKNDDKTKRARHKLARPLGAPICPQGPPWRRPQAPWDL